MKTIRCWVIVLYVCLVTGTAFSGTDLVLTDPNAHVFYLEGYHCYDEVRIGTAVEVQIHPVNSGSEFAVIHCATFTLEEGGMIGGDAQGTLVTSIGFGGEPKELTGGNGGSYGGIGGRPGMEFGGDIYGTEKGLDIAMGSVGGYGSSVSTNRGDVVTGGFGGAGGASIAIFAKTCIVDGELTMDGAPGENRRSCPPRDGCLSPPRGGGGGSGGGILLVAEKIVLGEKCVISADGGDTGDFVGGGSAFGGGGGRIKIFYKEGVISSHAKLSVKPGKNLTWMSDLISPGTGTIWIEKVSSLDEILNPNADLNGDGRVDSADLLLLQAQWGVTDASARQPKEDEGRR